MKKAMLVFAVAFVFAACGSGNTEAAKTDSTAVAADSTAVDSAAKK